MIKINFVVVFILIVCQKCNYGGLCGTFSHQEDEIAFKSSYFVFSLKAPIAN